jgi:radical SAM protein with 4Fe4S-binding SPASM domain
MVSNTLIPLVNVLDDKKGALKEAHLILFERCNMRCSFCHQDHESEVSTGEAILEKVKTLILNSNPQDQYVLNITGGELFMDEISDELFVYYFMAGRTLLEHFKDAKLVFGTNLVFQDTARVRRLIDMLRKYGKVYLATSYDPAGRFNAEQRKLFFHNLMEVEEYVDTINVVITRQNIEVFLKGQEGPEFDVMCAGYNVYFDHYIPSNRFEEHQPTEHAISDLYLRLNERYPNSYPIKAWKEERFNATTCRSTKIINKDGVVTTCWSEAGKDAILDEDEGLAAKQAAEERFLDKYDCLACEYYTRCGLRCFLHHSFVDDGNSECQIKLMFNRIL